LPSIGQHPPAESLGVGDHKGNLRTRLNTAALGSDAEPQGVLHGRVVAWKSAIAGHNLFSLARTGGAYWAKPQGFCGLFRFDRWNDLTACRALIQMHFSAKLPFGSPKLTEGSHRE
jgi:hypothetical protein